MSLYYGGRILTMVGDKPSYVEAVVEKDGKIAFAGSLADARKKFSRAKDVNLHGKTMMPGHIDPHLHPSMGALILRMHFITPFRWVLPSGVYEGVRNETDYRSRLSKLITEKPGTDEKFLITWGYHGSFHGDMSKEIIDQLNDVARSTPVVVWQRSFHEVYLNTYALDHLDYGDNKEELMNHSQVDWDIGHFYEMGLDALMSLTSFGNQVFPLMDAGYSDLVQVVHQNGLTTVADLEFPLFEEKLEMGMVTTYLKSKDTHFSTYCVPSGRNNAKLTDGDNQKAIEHIRELAKSFSDDKVIVYNNHIKGLLDGAFYSLAMQMKDGYIDEHGHGEWITEPEELLKAMRVYWMNGFQIHVHTNGDLGMEKLLWIVETLNQECPRPDHRTTVEHAGYFTEEQADKIAKLRVLVSAATYYFHALADQYSIEGLGPERAHAIAPMKWLFDRGVTTTFHSDFTMAPSQPLLLAWTAINRQTADGFFHRDDLKITAYQGMQAITKNAAIILGTDDIMGTIEVGKLANFTILDENPVEVDSMHIKDIKIHAAVYKGTMRTI